MLRLILCIIFNRHRKAQWYSTNSGPVTRLDGPFGRTFVEVWPCSRCKMLFLIRVKSQPHHWTNKFKKRKDPS